MYTFLTWNAYFYALKKTLRDSYKILINRIAQHYNIVGLDVISDYLIMQVQGIRYT